MHYKTFAGALQAWNRRKLRMNADNFGVVFCNFDGDENILRRFDNLPFKHKVAFTHKEYPQYASAFCLHGMERGGQVYATRSITGRRYIDEFDYVNFINNLTR